LQPDGSDHDPAWVAEVVTELMEDRAIQLEERLLFGPGYTDLDSSYVVRTVVVSIRPLS
jgi:hypothetical protein